MNMLQICFNWRVLAGLAAIGAAVYIVAPSSFAAALAVLLVLACPPSMLIMIIGMRGMSGERTGVATAHLQPAQLTSEGSLSHEQQFERSDAPQEATGASRTVGSTR
jgi:hypothetical protein